MDFIYFLGRFHVLVLHLPIGIIVALFVLESLSARSDTVTSRPRRRTSGARWRCRRSSRSCSATCTSGRQLHGASAAQHRFYGTAVALVAMVVALLRMGKFAESYKPLFFPASIVLLVLVSITGHFGGNLTHGSTYLVEYAPQPLRSLAGLAPRRTITSVSTADPFADVVGPMFVERCASCHNEDKQESDLVLTTHAGVMRGGESGRVVAPATPI